VTVGAMFGRAAGDYDGTRGRLVWPGEVGCRHEDHRFAVYSGKKGREDSEGRKDADD
jgi:hypothetical protein